MAHKTIENSDYFTSNVGHTTKLSECTRQSCPTAQRLRSLIPTRFRTAAIRQVIAETHDTRSFLLELDQGWFHKPGQHVRVALQISGCRHERHFSLSNTPSSAGPTITVKRHPEGYVSSWIVANLSVGSLIEISDPEGEFVLQHGSDQLLFLAAGSGITPIASMIRQALSQGRSATLLHVDRTPADGILRGEFRHLLSKHPQFHYIPWFTNLKGRPDAELQQLLSAVPSEIYLCGPHGFMDRCTEIAMAAGIRPDQIFQESFGVPGTGGSETINILVRDAEGRTRTVSGRVGATLLEILRREIGHPSICGGRAICGTCRVRLENGDDTTTAPATRAEARLLQVLPHPLPTHRLACQIRLAAEHEGVCFTAAPIT